MRRILFLVLGFLLIPAALLAGGQNRYFPLNYSGVVEENYAGTPTAGWNFDAAVGGTYVNDYGSASATMTVSGSPTLISGDGTWPAGISGTAGKAWSFDGVADYLSRADDGSFDMDLTNNPGGDFSIQCVVTPSTITSGVNVIAAKFLVAGNQRAWRFYQNNASLNMAISDDGTNDGGHFTTNTIASVLASNRPAFITHVYDYTSDGSSVSTFYVDNHATDTSNIMDGPVYDSTADFAVADQHGGGAGFNGLFSDCRIYKGIIITEAQHDQAFSRWQGRSSTAGDSVRVAVGSASPPAIQQKPCATEDGCFIDQPSNSGCIGIHGLPTSSDTTNLPHRTAICETPDGSNHPTGWSTTETAGDGSAAVDCDTTTYVYGSQSVKMVLTGTTSAAQVTSNCMTTGIASEVYFSARGKKDSGTSSFALRLVEYDTAACGSLLTTDTVDSGDLATSWAREGGKFAAGSWNGATSSYKIQLRETCNGGCTIYWDAPQVRVASYPVDHFCGSDSDASAVCTATIPSITSPLSGNGPMTVVGTWRSPWAGTDLSADTPILNDGNEAAANTYSLGISATTDEPVFVVVDNAADTRYVPPNVLNWAADTDYTLKARTGGNNDPGIYWNGAWDSTTYGTGTGMRSAKQSTIYIGSSHTTPANVWTKELRFYWRKLP